MVKKLHSTYYDLTNTKISDKRFDYPLTLKCSVVMVQEHNLVKEFIGYFHLVKSKIIILCSCSVVIKTNLEKKSAGLNVFINLCLRSET